MRIACAAIVMTALLGADAADPKTVWHSSVADAFAEAQRAHKPVLAVLHCPH